MTPMSRDQAEALAAFLVTLRPGQRDWTKTACLEALIVARTTIATDAETIARAAIRAALTARIRTPSVIGMTGEHWESKALPNEPARAVDCLDCRTTHMPGEHHPAGGKVTPEKGAERIAALRAAHTEGANAWHRRLCTCGSDARTCQRHEVEATA